VYDNNGYLGGIDKQVSVSGNGRHLRNRGNLYIGDHGSTNEIYIGSGGSIVASNVYIYLNPDGRLYANGITVSGGACT